MKKNYILIAGCALLASCASDDEVKKTTYNTPGCQTQNFKIDSKPIDIKVCLQQASSKPTKYLVEINKETIYSGESNKQTVKFSGKLSNPETTVVGGCVGIDKIVRADNKKNLEYSAFPEDIASSCNIKRQADGSSSSFVGGGTCYKKIRPFLEKINTKVFPIEESKHCVISINGKPAFAKTFNFEIK